MGGEDIIKFEYKVILIEEIHHFKDRVFNSSMEKSKLRFENKLNDLGKDGWELVGIYSNTIVFKRICE